MLKGTSIVLHMINSNPCVSSESYSIARSLQQQQKQQCAALQEGLTTLGTDWLHHLLAMKVGLNGDPEALAKHVKKHENCMQEIRDKMARKCSQFPSQVSLGTRTSNKRARSLDYTH